MAKIEVIINLIFELVFLFELALTAESLSERGSSACMAVQDTREGGLLKVLQAVLSLPRCKFGQTLAAKGKKTCLA